MTITEDMLIRQIAENLGCDVATIRKLWKAAEDTIFNYLTSPISEQNQVIKLYTGIRLERTYIPKRTISKGMFQEMDCREHVLIKACISKYYNQKINDVLCFPNT